MSPSPRATALEILLDVEHAGTTLDRRMDRFRQESRFDRRDEAFVTALVYGVMRWRRRLDGIIDAVSTTPLSKIDRDILSIVRLGLFQMVFMDRVPNSAAVHTSVELAKARKKQWLAGFVNAVLRNAQRRLSDFERPPAGRTPAQDLALAQSMPEWLVMRWIEQFGLAEAEALCTVVNRIPPLTLRTNTLKSSRAGLMAALAGTADIVRPTSHAPEGLTVDALQVPLFQSRAFQDGWFQVQDEAAQAVSHLLAPAPGQTVLDACAGLGGKTAHIAALMHNQGRVWALDQDNRKLVALELEMQRLGIDIVKTRKADLQVTASAAIGGGAFDRILLDAPCSGLGVVRRNPDAKWSRTPQDIDRCARKQRRLLDTLADQLQPGGYLVYAVCTTEPEETKAVVDSFLKKHAAFAIDDEIPELPPSLRPFVDGRGCLRTAPHRHDTDGFFAVRLVKR